MGYAELVVSTASYSG